MREDRVARADASERTPVEGQPELPARTQRAVARPSGQLDRVAEARAQLVLERGHLEAARAVLHLDASDLARLEHGASGRVDQPNAERIIARRDRERRLHVHDLADDLARAPGG